MKFFDSFLAFGAACILVATNGSFCQAASNYQFTTITLPGGNEGKYYSINSTGSMAGLVNNASGQIHSALLFENGITKTFSVPGATYTEAIGLNNNGQIIGDWLDSSGWHGFLTTSSNFGALTPIMYPGSSSTLPWAINDSGVIVGFYTSPAYHGFIRSANGTYSSINYPGATDTSARGINDVGQICGCYRSNGGPWHGWVRDSSGNFISFDMPQAINTYPVNINNNGQIVGTWMDSSGKTHAFIRDPSGTLTGLDYPGAVETGILDNNDNGMIVGYYLAANGTATVFSGTPVNSPIGVPVMEGWWLFPGALAGLGIFARRRKA